MKAFIKKLYSSLPFALVAMAILFSLGNTLQYYFYTDDFAFLYYLGNNFNFGWPYNMVLPLFRPVYNLFGINALPYFSLALITYLLASVSVYFFAKHLTYNKLVAFLSSLIFATGYIGLEQFNMIAVSIINNLNIINVCITLIFLIKWIETKKLRYYFLTLFMFWFSMWLFPYRAYPLILFLPTLEFVKSFQLGNVIKMAKQFVFLVLRYVPFVLVASRHGVFSYGTHGTENIDLFYLLNPNSKIFTLFNFDFFKELFAILGRLVFIKPVSDIFAVVPDQNFYSLAGFTFALLIISTSLFLFFGKNSGYGRSLLVVLFLTIEGYVGNMFLNVDFDANGPINRYLTISFISFSVIFPLFLFIIIDKFEKFKWINKKWILISLVILVVLNFASLSRKYENFIIEERSLPTKSFYKQIKTYIPSLSNSSYNVFYFDKALYHPISSRFGNVLLSAAMSNDVNLAVPYGVNIESIKIVDTFDQFLRFIIYPPEGKTTIYYTFYNNEKGLQDTTSQVFTLLKNGSYIKIPNNQIHYTKKDRLSLINIETENVSSLTPINVKLFLRAIPEDSSLFTFPYLGTGDESVKDYYEKNNLKKSEIFRYLISREKYYQTVKVEVESIHIGKQNLASYLTDEKAETVWLSDQSRWEVDIKPWIKIDMGEVRNISKIFWRQLPNRVITDFTIETSMDENTWNRATDVRQGEATSDANLMAIEFSGIDAQFVRFTINNLATGKSPGPGMSEFEVIESEFRDVDLNVALRIKGNPFEYIRDEEELEQTYDYLSQNAKLKIKSMTNRDDPTSNMALLELPIATDGMNHEYTFQLPPGGTQLKNIKLEANFPANFFIDSVLLENLPQNVLNQQIKQKCLDFAKEQTYANPFDCKPN